MKNNERLLAIGVGAAVVCLVAFIAFRYYSSSVTAKQDQLADIEGKLLRQQNLVKEALKASKKLSDYERRSLPPQPAIARSAYQHWLLTKAEEAGLREQVVSPAGQRSVMDIYVQQSFTLTGKGRYEQIVKLLDDIYRVDLLHRVSRLSLKPVKDSKDLDVSLTLDAVSVRTAQDSQELHNLPSKRLKLDSVEKYQQSIVGRNIFAPANRAPQLSGLGRQRGETGRPVSITAKVNDPDKLDFVKLELTKSPSRDARLDSAGKLSWTPRSKGEYEFEITARDDSFPPNVVTEKLVVTVTDPPKIDPPPMRIVTDDDPPLAFDQAKHTVLSAIINVGEESEVWLYVRPTATTLKLHEGDPFEVGSIKGTIREIGYNAFVFESSAKKTKGQRMFVNRGDFLQNAALMLVETSTEARPTKEATEEDEPKTSKEVETKTPASEDVKAPPVAASGEDPTKTE